MSEKAVILDCACGGAATLDWTRATDIRGHLWQDVYIECEDCQRSITITVDGDVTQEAQQAEKTVVNMWNDFQGILQNEKA